MWQKASPGIPMTGNELQSDKKAALSFSAAFSKTNDLLNSYYC